MTEVIAVVHLDSGLVHDLPGSTPTFDVPDDFDREALGPKLRPVGRALSRRRGGEEFLLRSDSEGEVPTAGEPRWLLFVREPGLAVGGEG